MISYPPLQGKGTPTLGQNRQFQWFHHPSFIYPMVPASAATLLAQEGHEVLWDDAIAEKRSYESFIQGVEQFHPDLIAMETKTPVVRQHWRIVKDLKARFPDLKTVLMGDHITALPEQTLRESPVDYVLTGGDYDVSLSGLLKHLDQGQSMPPGMWWREGNSFRNSGPFELTHDLNLLPWVDRKLTHWELYGEKFFKRSPFTYTMVGRDCPWGKCTFCSWTTLFPRFRSRTPESLLDELEMLVREYGVREVFDDTGTFPSGAWLRTFCEGMIQRGLNKKILLSINFRFDFLQQDLAHLMKKAGFRLMKLGLESGNDDTLKRLCKGTTIEKVRKGAEIAKKAGLEVHLTIMVGYPWETRKDAENTLNLAREFLDKGYAHMLQSTVVVPYPGSPLHAECVAQDWLDVDPEDYESLDMTRPVLKTPDMTPAEVMEICDRIYKAFLTPRFVIRHLSRWRGLEDVQFSFKGFYAAVGHIRDFKREQ